MFCKFRHPAIRDLGLSPCTLVSIDGDRVHVRLKDGFESVLTAPGQVLALYRLIGSNLIVQMEYDHGRDESLLYECLGGGVNV